MKKGCAVLVEIFEIDKHDGIRLLPQCFLPPDDSYRSHILALLPIHAQWSGCEYFLNESSKYTQV